MTDLSKKMDSIANNGYRANMARRILTGHERRMAKQTIVMDIIDVIQEFDADTLTELYTTVKFLRKRDQILPEASTEGQAGGCEGKLGDE